MRKFIVLVTLLGLAGFAGAWFWAGRAVGPIIEIRQPERFIGQVTSLDLAVESPDGQFVRVDVTLEQGDRSYPVFTLAQPTEATVRQETAERIYIIRPIGGQDLPELQPGPARIVVRTARPVLYGLREAESELARDVDVRLDPPRVEVRSTLHYINHGGAEFVVYRATPADVDSGVRVGDQIYPGYPASGAGIPADETTRVAFFALLQDQDLNTPISLWARDPAGNETTAALGHRAFPKQFARSRIGIDDRFVQRVVPAIAATTPEMALSTAPEDLVASFLRINGDLRRENDETIAGHAEATSPELLWRSAFQALGNASVEAGFADNRTYLYQGEEIDRQVHLGFDLAVTQRIPILAANTGVILYAADLGIYGNCVIVDHGLGVQSLYAHLSSIDVQVGDRVEQAQVLGRSGMTGLAGGDHLHFTMLVNGHAVNPVEWWDPKWMQDRVLRKIAEAGGNGVR
jgi:murein DD-endopeptidase MepM/ murein hydrolase activator NlpD